MGKVEKIVVLSVLFLIAVILSVSLDVGGSRRADEGAEGDSVAGGTAGLGDAEGSVLAAERPREVPPLDVAGEGPDPEGEWDDASAAGESGVLLTGAVEPTSADDEAEGLGQPLAAATTSGSKAGVAEAGVAEDWDLVTIEQLGDSLDPTLKVYTCVRGDTFATVAARYYGDAGAAELLRRYNEGLTSLEGGQELLVPVARDEAVGTGDYEVLEGESLWRIAKKVYGKGHRWTEIWEANKDLLRSPDRVRAGMVLIIP